VHVPMFWRYFTFSVLVGRYSRSLNSPPSFMILGLFKSTMMSFKGLKETRGAYVCILEIFFIFCFGR